MSVPDKQRVPFSVQLEVRDYECDQQGIVNNAVYQNYLEHARHCLLRACGIDFAEVTRSGLFLVVIRAEIDYKKPLRAGDAFSVSVAMEQLSPIRFAFQQIIQRTADATTVAKATIFTASMDRSGRPARIPQELLKTLPLA